MILLAAVAAIQSASGCRPVGHAVRCELAAPRPVPVSIPVAQPAPRARPASVTPRPKRVPRPATTAEIDRHVGSLTAIADCTGARTYLLSIGRAVAARETFDRCVGAPPASPPSPASPPPIGP